VARDAAQGGARAGQHGRSSSAPHGPTQSLLAKASKAVNASPLIAAIVTAVISIPASFLTGVLTANHLHQGAANEAAIQGQQQAAAAALNQDAELVDFGLGTVPHSSSPQIVIENRSSGWIRNMTLVVPVPVQQTREANGEVNINFPSFGIYTDGGNGFYGIRGTADGGFVFSEPLPDIGPCELAVTTALKSFPNLNPATLAKSELYFTDPNGNAWMRFGSGKLVRNSTFKGSGTWSPYAVLEPLPGCSSG
jgi:hypothetical protein